MVLRMSTIAVVNFKGGTGKTTAAAWMLHALAESGLDVYGIDADPQGSLVKWAELGEWSIPVAGLPVSTLHQRVQGVAGPRDVVVIDAPPLEQQKAIVLSAIRAATHVLVPLAPTPIEYDEMAKVAAAMEDVAPLQAQPASVGVLLTRVRSGTASHAATRDQLSEDGWHVLAAHVPMLERFAQSYGSPISGAPETAYADAVAELLGAVLA
jgi:chromosome partitioning protein